MTIESWVTFIAVGYAISLFCIFLFFKGASEANDEHETMHQPSPDRLYVTITADIHLSLGSLQQRSILARNLRLFAEEIDNKQYGLLATETANIGDSVITYSINEWV